jgi:hypothetical protein
MILPLAFALIQAEPSYQAAETTIAAVRAHPDRFAGKLIRLRGWINRCQSLSCSIDEKRFDKRDEQGQSLSIGADEIFDSLVRDKTPVHVVIDAAFNPICLKDEVCLDRAPELGIIRAALDPTGDTLPTRD